VHLHESKEGFEYMSNRATLYVEVEGIKTNINNTANVIFFIRIFA